MVEVTVVYEGREHVLDVDVDDPATVLSFQLFSLVGLDVDQQVLVSASGRPISPEETYDSFAGNGKNALLYLFKATHDLDEDWQHACTRIVAPNVPLAQPAFTADGVPTCQACARTCCTQGPLVTPLENDAATRDLARAKFVCDLDIVVGTADISPPIGFTKVNFDLNHSASGPFVFLCYKKGGSNRPIAHVKVVHTQDENVPVVPGYDVVPVNCNIGTKSSIGVYICYRRVSSQEFRRLEGLAIEEIEVGKTFTAPWIQLETDLNAGNENAISIYLGYKVNLLGGFVCGHKSMCLYESRVLEAHPSTNWTQLSGAQITAAYKLGNAQREVWQAASNRRLSAQEPQLKQILIKQLEGTLKYERKDYQQKALSAIPVQMLQERARANPSPQPTFEIAGEAGRVEVYRCGQCQALTRFPRYNDPTKLLQTRTGRCGEWANCFTLCCRALGYEARYVHDFTDHVWTEVYSNHHQRWLHCDPCEDQMDCPLTYEVGWGKKLNYIFATSCEEIVDVARRYTRDFDALLDRRTMGREEWLQQTIAQLNQTKALSPERRQILNERAQAEERELSATKVVKAHETVGRISGSKEWRDARDESGQSSTDIPVSGSDSQLFARPTGKETLVEVLKRLLENMVKGGCANEKCVNKFCFNAIKRAPGFDYTTHVSNALHTISTLQAVSVEGLRTLFCPQQESFQEMILSSKLVSYWPLQDHVSSILVDASGRGAHATNYGPPLLKPLPWKLDKRGTGLQLLQSKGFKSTIESPTPNWSLVWLVSWHDFGSKSSTPSQLVSLQTSDASLVLEVTTDLKLQWKHNENVSATSIHSLQVDTTYLLSIVTSETGESTVYANGQEVFRVKSIVVDTAIELALGYAESSSTFVPVVSHVAWAEEAFSSELVKALAYASVPSPKLSKFGVEAVDPALECDEAPALEDSGFRLAAVHLWAGEFFDGLQCEYVNESRRVVPGRSWTVNSSGKKHSLVLQDGEYIVKVEGRRGAWMDQLALTTNYGRTVSAGGQGGGPFEIKLPPGHQARAFNFELGDHVNHPVVFSCPAIQSPLVKALEDAKTALGASVVVRAVQGVLRYITNIANDKTNAKFHKIKQSNSYFQSNVAPLGDHLTAIFSACSFTSKPEGSEEFFVFDTQTTVERVRGAIYDLNTFVAKES